MRNGYGIELPTIALKNCTTAYSICTMERSVAMIYATDSVPLRRLASTREIERRGFGVPAMRVMVIMFAAALSLAASGGAVSADQSPVGLWQAIDSDTKEPGGWFLVSEKDGVYSAILAKMFLKPGQDPNRLCDQCKDDRHNHPWRGLELVRGMKQDPDTPDKYIDGTILDPRDGKVYSANMTVTPDGQTLILRGYLGISLLGRNEYWTRLPDADYSLLDPSINPNPAAAQPQQPPLQQPARQPMMAPAKPAPAGR
jgi:uncharacterized protein (DUF2147 family)